MNNKCVYVFLDNRKKGEYVYGDYKFDYEPIYVGKGSKYRISDHKRLSNIKNNSFYVKYKDILNDTKEHPKYLIFKNNLSEEDSIKIEEQLIKKIGRLNTNEGPLTNEKSNGFIHTCDLNKLKIIFIKKANKKHNNFYDYNESKYVNNKTKIEIKCPIHGYFYQRPDDHLNGHGCSKCSKNNKYTKDEIFKILNDKHNNLYIYDLNNYENINSKIKIYCEIHGEFTQMVKHHMNGQKCPKCMGKYINNDDFIKKSNIIHNYKYDYPDKYINSKTKINIFCPLENHGIFNQTSHDHLAGRGCPKCGKLKIKKGI